MNILVTAGPTCEDIDAVRYLTNRSSGRMGYTLAAAAVRRGHGVTLVTGPTALERPEGCDVVAVRSAREMHGAVFDRFAACDCVIMAAAVADFRPEKRAEGKIKKGADRFALQLVPNPDILAELGKKKDGRILVGFALESDEGRRRAEQKLHNKQLDFIVLNSADAFGNVPADFGLYAKKSGWVAFHQISKDEIADIIIDECEKLCTEPL